MRRAAVLVFVLSAVALPGLGQSDGKLMLWVDKNFASKESPLHTELSINGKVVNIYTADTFESVDSYIKPGWNTVTVKTTAQEPADDMNDLIFRIGPAYRDPKNRKKIIMSPVLWQFRNGTDWEVQDNGTLLHALGPDVKDVTLRMKLFYAGMDVEKSQLKAGDVVLQGKSKFASNWNTNVTAMVYVNGTPLNSFTLGPGRTIVITPYLKKGKNDIKIVSNRVDNAVTENDIVFEVAGPAVWDASEKRYMVKPLLKFNAAQGWTRDSRTGKLVNRMKADADTIERVIPLMLKDESAE